MAITAIQMTFRTLNENDKIGKLGPGWRAMVVSSPWVLECSSAKASDLCLLRSLGQCGAENELGSMGRGRGQEKYPVFGILPFSGSR